MEKNRKNSRKLFRASLVVVALLVLFPLFSCSSDSALEICRVDLRTEDTGRDLKAVIVDPLLSYNIYYRSIYKGSGASFGGMSSDDAYVRLGNDGILLSQGLWDIEVLFSTLDTLRMTVPTM